MRIFFKFLFPLIIFAFMASCQSNQNTSTSQTKNVTTLAPLEPFSNNTIDGLLVSVSDQSILLSDLQNAILAASNGQTQILANGKLIGGKMTPEQANQILQSIINQKVLQIKS